MPNVLPYEDYYLAQMKFIDRFIRQDFMETDQARLKRIEQSQPRQSISFLDDFLNVEAGKELETTRIGYKPFNDADYTPQQLSLAPNANIIKPNNRRLTRYRLVYGPVDFYLGSQLEEPLEIPVITACAPNMMSFTVDLDDFSEGGRDNRELKVEAYEKECQKLANFIVGEAKERGQAKLIMPAFGVGVYISKLSPSAKEQAREAMYKAFAAAAEKHQMNIDWIVWSRERNSDDLARKLANYAPQHQFMQPVIHEDMMLYAQERLKKLEKVVLLNPGSDRTVGGAYAMERPYTLEEQMAQQSDLLFLHSEFNQPMVEEFKKAFAERKKRHEASSTRSAIPLDGEPLSSSQKESTDNKINNIINAIHEAEGKHQKQKIFIDKINADKLSVAECITLYDKVKKIQGLNAHRNPHLDSFFGIKNTASWRKTLGEFRKKALDALFEEVKCTADKAGKRELLNRAKKLPLFNEHRNNSIFFGAWGRTSAVREIEEQVEILGSNVNRP